MRFGFEITMYIANRWSSKAHFGGLSLDFLFDIYYNTPMGTQSDYFNEKGYKPKYWIGDRVFGHWNNIPFVGTVGNDTVINEANGPQISIHLDLPIRFRDKTHNIIIVKHKDVKKLVEMN